MHANVRFALVPGAGLLVRVSHLQNSDLSPVRASDLQADGKTLFCEATGNRYCRQTPDIERPGISQQDQLPRAQKVRMLLQLGNGRRRDRNARSHQHIHIFENASDLLAQLFNSSRRSSISWAETFSPLRIRRSVSG